MELRRELVAMLGAAQDAKRSLETGDLSLQIRWMRGLATDAIKRCGLEQREPSGRPSALYARRGSLKAESALTHSCSLSPPAAPNSGSSGRTRTYTPSPRARPGGDGGPAIAV